MAEEDRDLPKTDSKVGPKLPAKRKDANQFVASSDAAIQQGEVVDLELRPSDVIQTIVDQTGRTSYLVQRMTGESFRYLRAIPEEAMRAQEEAHEKYLRCRRKRTMDNTVVVAELTLSSDDEVAPREEEAVDQASNDVARELRQDEVRGDQGGSRGDQAEKEPEAKRGRDCEEEMIDDSTK